MAARRNGGPAAVGARASGEALAVVAAALARSVPAVVAHLRAAPTPRVYREALALMERPLLAHALALTGGNQVRAARLLGVNRNTLRKRCRALGLAAGRARRAPGAVAE